MFYLCHEAQKGFLVGFRQMIEKRSDVLQKATQTHVVLLVMKTALYKHKWVCPRAPVTFRVAALVPHWKTK